jgi:hypothetical protein
MMDNLARIISHVFAIVVVILLGIGFIYRGELFPDLELPDFLVPESGKMADASGAHPDMTQAGTGVTPGTMAGEPVKAAPSTPAAPPVETPAITPEAGVESETPAAAPPAGVIEEGIAARSAPQEAQQTETLTETLQAPPEVVPPPEAEESAPAGGASAGRGEAGSEMTSDTVPPPVPAVETPAESQPEVPIPPTGLSEETSMEPGATTEMEPQSGTQTPLAGEEPYPAEAIHEGTEPTTGRSVSGSPPVSAAEMQPGAGTAGPSSGKTPAEAKPYELLAAAREAFWMHNYDDAEKSYRALTELEPKNPDGYGELGNMYFSQGRWDEAAAAYYEAGTRLITEGRLEAARELVNVIRGLNGKQADELEKLVTSAGTAGNN